MTNAKSAMASIDKKVCQACSSLSSCNLETGRVTSNTPRTSPSFQSVFGVPSYVLWQATQDAFNLSATAYLSTLVPSTTS